MSVCDELLLTALKAFIWAVTALTVYVAFVLCLILYEDGARNIVSNLRGYLDLWRKK